MKIEQQTNILDPNCPSRKVLEIIANKWAMMIVRVLSRDTHRFGQLQRSIKGVTQKMLMQTLRQLERDGIVKRTSYPVVPPVVEYALTPLGQTLIEPINAITIWAEQHVQEVEVARSTYNETAPGEAAHLGT